MFSAVGWLVVGVIGVIGSRGGIVLRVVWFVYIESWLDFGRGFFEILVRIWYVVFFVVFFGY